MSQVLGYGSADAFRVALEQRLKNEAHETAIPHDRLRKEAAFHRLLARFKATAPADSWALKGGMAMVARLGLRARATRDVDANWRAPMDTLEDVLGKVIECDLEDGFSFEVGRGRKLVGEGPEGGLRFPITARLAGREFERLRLDINLAGHDDRTVESVPLNRNPFEFAGVEPLVVPVIPPAQQLAEKIHAHTRTYRGEMASSRVKDLFDLLVIPDELTMPPAGEVVKVSKDTFARRSADWPPTLPPPPIEWQETWAAYVREYALRWQNLFAAQTALEAFWQPVFSESASPDSVWERVGWRWTRVG